MAILPERKKVSQSEICDHNYNVNHSMDVIDYMWRLTMRILILPPKNYELSLIINVSIDLLLECHNHFLKN